MPSIRPTDWNAGGTEAEVEHLGEAAPRRCAIIALDLHVLELGATLQIVRRHPYLLLLGDPLLMEEGLASVDEREGIGLAVELGEVHLLETGRPVVVVLAGEPVALAGG